MLSDQPAMVGRAETVEGSAFNHDSEPFRKGLICSRLCADDATGRRMHCPPQRAKENKSPRHRKRGE